MGIYAKPSKRGDVKIYRLRASYRRRIIFMDLFFLLFIPFAAWGFSINSKSILADILIYSFILLGVVWLSWFTFQVIFVFRLELDSGGGVFHAFHRSSTFKWEDAKSIDYHLFGRIPRVNLMLTITPSVVKYRSGIRLITTVSTAMKRNFNLPYLFAVPYSEGFIPLDTVQKYEPFVVRGLTGELPSSSELNLHFRYFLKTPLGQDLLHYAPHLFADVMNKYLPDDDIALS